MAPPELDPDSSTVEVETPETDLPASPSIRQAGSRRGDRRAHVNELTQDDPEVAESQTFSNRVLDTCTDSLSQVCLDGGEKRPASRTSKRRRQDSTETPGTTPKAKRAYVKRRVTIKILLVRESTLPTKPGSSPGEHLEAGSVDQDHLAFSPRTSELKGTAREQNRKRHASKVEQSAAPKRPRVPATKVDRNYNIPLSPGSVSEEDEAPLPRMGLPQQIPYSRFTDTAKWVFDVGVGPSGQSSKRNSPPPEKGQGHQTQTQPAAVPPKPDKAREEQPPPESAPQAQPASSEQQSEVNKLKKGKSKRSHKGPVKATQEDPQSQRNEQIKGRNNAQTKSKREGPKIRIAGDPEVIKILQLNFARKVVVSEELKVLIGKHDIDVMLLQEPRYRKKSYVDPPTYYCQGLGESNIVSSVHDTQPWAAVVETNPRVGSMDIASLCNANCVVVEINFTHQRFYAVSMYFQSKDVKKTRGMNRERADVMRVKQLTHLDHVLHKLKGEKVVIGIDANCEYPAWSP
ncbi:hypothetical protein QAD02_010478 [Eretmocerus hayati]|uniref:Uncharacterized protein n=1 Tax=Eretmocerus hayati TaxID=131215 RepID=A0ACC2NU76_9HYME|nr:hypothetical protein QAD02_010478 [Eretmocerus hayati]